MKIRSFLCALWTVVAMSLLATNAQAQLFRAYVSLGGSDSNPCTVGSPCRLLPAALAAVADGGEIWMLDSANYNASTVFITKSVSILSIPGQVGSLVARSGAAVVIGTAGVKVKFRNVVFVGYIDGSGTQGINMYDGAALTVEDSLFTDLPNAGILVTNAAQVRVTNTILRDIGVSAIWLTNGATGDVSNTKAYGIGNLAIRADGGAAGTTSTLNVSDSVVSESYVGFATISFNSTGVGRLFCTRCTASNNGFGFAAQSNAGGTNTAVTTVSYSTATNNGQGFSQIAAGSVFKSPGNSAVHDNALDIAGTITPISLH